MQSMVSAKATHLEPKQEVAVGEGLRWLAVRIPLTRPKPSQYPIVRLSTSRKKGAFAFGHLARIYRPSYVWPLIKTIL